MNPPSQYSTIPSLHRSVLVQRISKSASLIAAALFLQLPANLEGKELISEGDVVVVPLRGEVAPSLLAFLRRAVKTAESNEASAIIFDMNTYGGRLDTATDIVNALNQTKNPELHVHQHKCRVRWFAYRHCHTTHLHGAGERNWRRRTDPLQRRGFTRYREGEDDFVLVCAHPWFRDEEWAQSGCRRSVHQQGQRSEDWRPRRSPEGSSAHSQCSGSN